MNCIDIKDKHDCCGCGACADACPKSCIEMTRDSDGFVYPKINYTECVSCGKCKAVCPVKGAESVKNKTDDNLAYAYVSQNEKNVRESSSGGAFSLIMDAVASQCTDYAIVGAAFDGTEVRHVLTTDRISSEALKKSKYVQSDTTGIYKLVKEKLLKKTTVVFSGTPCQVAALKCYLGRDWENLLTVDIVCHGVAGQAVFSEYLSELEKKNGSKIAAVGFRHKRNFHDEKPNPRTINILFCDGRCLNMDMSESEYLYAYYTGLIYRPSCESCRFACPSRPGDITLGDYWGIEKIHPDLNSLKGVSLVRFNTEKGKFLIDYFKKSGIFLDTDWDFACSENYQLNFPTNMHRNRDKFFRLRSRGVSFCDNVAICKKPDNICQKVVRKIGRLLKTV